jgi:ubiquinone/menaquinone biosynthesis C-methylase UbiE
MDRLAGAEELLDGPLDDRAALIGNLRDLARVNHRLGGADLSAKAIDGLAPGRASIAVLDIGTGAADIPLALIERGRVAGRLIRVTGVDSRPEVLEAAALIDPRVTATRELALHVADGLALPYPDEAFEVVHASMVAHHLDPDAVRALFAEMRRVARLGVVVNDLVRGRANWLGAWLLARIATRNRLTRNDAPLSVRRAYSVAELTALMAAAGLSVERRYDGFAGHRVALAARRNGRG